MLRQDQQIITYQSKNMISKYRDLDIENEKMCHLKTTTLLVMVGALGMIKKGTDKHNNKISCRPSIYEMKMIALCGTAHLLRKVLSMNVTEKKKQQKT